MQNNQFSYLSQVVKNVCAKYLYIGTYKWSILDDIFGSDFIGNLSVRWQESDVLIKLNLTLNHI